MTDNNHPITPPTSLVQSWIARPACQDYFSTVEEVAIEAARWGADQELEACCHLLRQQGFDVVDDLRATRRPKPPSLKEQALQALALLKVDASTHGLGFDSSAIRRALESLPD